MPRCKTVAKVPLADAASTCSGCKVVFNDNNESLTCDICDGSFHPCCVGFTDAVYIKFAEIREVTGWVCASCRKESTTKLNALQAAHASLAEQFSSLQQSVTELQNNSSAPTSTRNYADALKTTEVKSQLHQEVRSVIKENDRRSRNILISGLDAVEGSDDSTVVSELFERDLSLKPQIERTACRRVGKLVEGRPRKLLVTLRSAESATEILKNAKKLRSSSNPNIKDFVYINKDLSKDEAKAAYDLRVKKRSDAATAANESSSSADGSRPEGANNN